VRRPLVSVPAGGGAADSNDGSELETSGAR
jgi:hypothetical protein